MKKNFYITTTLPYVNADPHIGFAMELVRADVIARAKQLQGFDVFFNTGTDEHGQKIYQKALEAGLDPQNYVNDFSQIFSGLQESLGIANNVEGIHFNFVRTTDKEHTSAAQEFWKRCEATGDIYKKAYQIKYCVGCELEKTESELDQNGHCLLHPNLEIELIDEENYFFRWSRYEKPLLDFYEKNSNFVIPDFRFNEIKAFVSRGLQDFSISRLKSKMSWGIEVPCDPDHVMYVWFDALVNYISTLGWPEDANGDFDKFWVNGTPVQYAGKDNLRQQSAMWQAMLMSAGLPNSHSIIIDGFVTKDGQKMSKSLGNTVNPHDLVTEYGTDALRYYVLRELSPFEDSDFTMEKFKEVYNANLANGLGNLVARTMKMAEGLKYDIRTVEYGEFPEEYKKAFDQFNIKNACDFVWQKIGEADKKIQDTTPFKLVKVEETKEEGENIIKGLVQELYFIAELLTPILPETSKKIKEAIKENKKPETLFARKD